MFVTSFAIPAEVIRAHRARSASAALAQRPDTFALLAVLGWLAIGGFALALLPHSRAGADLGATLPYWLVGAPLVDLAWLMRKRLARVLGQAARCAHGMLGRQRCVPRRLPATGALGSASRQARRANIS